MSAPGLGGDTPQAVAGNAYLFGRSHDVTWKIPKSKSLERIWCPFKGFADGKGLDANLTNHTRPPSSVRICGSSLKNLRGAKQLAQG